MIKKILIYLTLLTPLAAFSQNDAPVLKKFYKDAGSTPDVLILNAQVNIIAVQAGKKNSDVMAVNDHMETLWTTPLTGSGVITEKFKDKIVAITTDDEAKDIAITKAFILDPKTGKILLEKKIVETKKDYLIEKQIFTGEGKYLKIALRETGFKNTLHVASVFSNPLKTLNETRDISVIEYDDLLNPKQYKLDLHDGTLENITTDINGNLIVSWLNQNHLEIVKYGTGSNTAITSIKTDLPYEADKNYDPSHSLHLISSTANPNTIYCAAMFSNQDNKTELSIGKFDFATGKTNFTEEVFTNDHLKSLRKAFVPINKKMDAPTFESKKSLAIRYFKEAGEKLVVSVSARTTEPSSIGGGSWMTESSFLLNIYDTDINLKAQQFLPVSYSVPFATLPTAYHYNDGKL
ncbi:hypothetical protein JN11_04618 [Mucilaginibacter frigoritolerans]|uniref:Uncharacterized protein n=1 Tax=Mucilaginibacter frigoritolerans TaxID=652788 RepID=A0A562TNY4_9SPHI|nr:hypothetical protein [Mucilaginibacter frigoritolerans]TWI94836.1 hypothetical protein JN11_04618 [Mucilaginibacter frigoritolerans]